MSKKDDAQVEVQENEENTKDDFGQLEKDFGRGIFKTGNHIVDSKNVVIPVSPAIDIILGGGIPEGSFVIFTSKPKHGKSTTALDFAATAQQQQYSSSVCPQGREVYYFNIEGRLKPRDVAGIQHLDRSKFFVISSEPGNILTGQKYMQIGERLINEKPGCIFIFDSFSQLCTSGEMESELGSRYRADSPVLLAQFCRRISNVVPINKSIVIGITHLIANQGGMGMSPWVEASGQKIQYQVDVKLKATHYTDWKSGEKIIGQDVHWDCETSAIGPPGGKCTSKLRYGQGLDKVAELIDICCALGIISKAAKGGWYTMPDGKKLNGTEAAKEYIIENKMYDDFYKQVREIYGFAL